ncbi:MAG: hypothetical protein DMF62_02320 [Acidobacteria bacterium]|nr:MAG: hypothetical protein DMF62_02320 [Acidobacteriota bacterium]
MRLKKWVTTVHAVIWLSFTAGTFDEMVKKFNDLSDCQQAEARIFKPTYANIDRDLKWFVMYQQECKP